MDKETSYFKVLSDPTRLRLAILLARQGETCVCKLSEALSEPEYKVSRHLGVMRNSGIVQARREGTWMYYQLSPPSNEMETCLLGCFRDCFTTHPTTKADMQRLLKSACAPEKVNLQNENGKTMSEFRKKKILFLCTGNSCRSQMAEGWCRHLKGDRIEAYSAGIETHGLNPSAVQVMAEAGVDISGHHSKHLDELKGIGFDYVITVCDNAHESCPVFPGKTSVVHIGFDDPPRLAKEAKTEEEALNCYRCVRDQIRAFIETLPELLNLKK